MTPKQRNRVLRHRRDGYRLWRIAEMVGVSINDAAEVLVDAGRIHESLVELTVANESKYRRQSVSGNVGNAIQEQKAPT